MEYQELNLKKDDLFTTKHLTHIEHGIDAITTEVSKMKNVKIILRNDIHSHWEEVGDTVVLLEGEVAIEFPDEGGQPKLKIGDGHSTWNELEFLKTENEPNPNPEPSPEPEPEQPSIPEDLEERLVLLEETVNGYNIRIENTEAGVIAAVTAAEEALVKVEELTETTRAALEEQNTTLVAAQESIAESMEKVEGMAATVEEISLTQETQTMKIDTANARIDSILNSITSGANFDELAKQELEDIRIDYTGTPHESAGAAVRQIGYDLKELSQNLEGALGKNVPNGLGYEGNQLYLTANGVQIGEAVTIVSGGGGGGGSDLTYTIILSDLMNGQRDFVITEEEELILRYSYHSFDEDNYQDGPGIGRYYVDGNLVMTTSVPQGENEFNVTPYLIPKKQNSVKIEVENSEGTKKSRTYNVEVLALEITSTVAKLAHYTGRPQIPYTVTGSGVKTVYFEIDGLRFYQETVATSGISRQVQIPEQLDGPHILSIYAEVSNGPVQTIRSNVLELGMLFHSSTTTSQSILMMKYEGPKEVEQGTTLVFPYLVYDPFLQTTDISLNIYNEDNSLYHTAPLTVDQSPQNWTTQDYPAGKVRFEIVSKDTTATQNINVKPTSFDREVITDGCVLDFNARGRSNNEANPAHWEFNGIAAEFNGFGWANIDGWIDTSYGQTALRFLPGDTMKINYKPFENDFRVSGYTVEAEFETHNVRDYDSVIVDAIDDGRGLIIKSQQANLSSEQTGIGIQFKEDSRVRVTFVVEQISLYRFVYIYINGVMSGVIQYPENDNFEQANPVEIFIGSESCGLDLYTLRMYNKGFTRKEQLNNFICDRPTLIERIKADNDNDVLDENGQVAIANLPMHIPYLILECEELPQYKGDKKKNKSVTYVEPLHPERSFTATGVQLDVQGTSSAGYPVKNYKVSLKGGLTYTSTNISADGFPIVKDGLEGEVICLKADFASSEQANNVCLVDYYEELSPYKTPAQEEDSRVRVAVRGFPCVVFWKNTTDNTITFVG